MIPLDLQRAVEYMELHWGRSNKWDRWEDLYPEFASFTAGALNQALNQLYRSGAKFTPSSSELWKAVSEVQAQRVAHDEDDIDQSCGGNHVWADPLPTDDDRHRTCVRCDEVGPAVVCEHLFQKGLCVYCLDKAEASDAA